MINFNILLIVSISIVFIILQGAGNVYSSPDWGTGETDWGTGETDWGTGETDWGTGETDWGTRETDWGTRETDWGTGETDWPADMNAIKPQQQEKDIKVIKKTCNHYLYKNTCKQSYKFEDGNVIYHVKIKHRHMNH